MPTKHAKPRASAGEPKKNGRPASKPGQTQRQRAIDPMRLRVVAEMMAGAIDYYDMQRTLSDRWAVSMRTIRSYRDRVLAEMHDELQDAGFLAPDLETVLGVRRLEEVYLAAMKERDYKAAAAIIKLRLMVVGVLGPQRHQHEHNFGGSPLVVAQAAPGSPAEAVMAAKLELARRLAKTMGARAAAKAVDAAAASE